MKAKVFADEHDSRMYVGVIRPFEERLTVMVFGPDREVLKKMPDNDDDAAAYFRNRPEAVKAAEAVARDMGYEVVVMDVNGEVTECE